MLAASARLISALIVKSRELIDFFDVRVVNEGTGGLIMQLFAGLGQEDGTASTGGNPTPAGLSWGKWVGLGAPCSG